MLKDQIKSETTVYPSTSWEKNSFLLFYFIATHDAVIKYCSDCIHSTMKLQKYDTNKLKL